MAAVPYIMKVMGPGFQVPFSERIRKEVPGLTTVAVGLITGAQQAEDIVEKGRADLVALVSIFSLIAPLINFADV